MLRATLVVLLVSFLAGCADPPPQATGDQQTGIDITNGDPYNRFDTPEARRTIVDSNGGGGFDLLCRFGGGPRMGRTATGHVPDGSTALTVELDVRLLNMPVQVGYALDTTPAEDELLQGNVTWLPSVFNENRTFEVPVLANHTEGDGRELWWFYYRANPASNDDLCYTGLGGPSRLRVIAAEPS